MPVNYDNDACHHRHIIPKLARPLNHREVDTDGEWRHGRASHPDTDVSSIYRIVHSVLLCISGPGHNNIARRLA